MDSPAVGRIIWGDFLDPQGNLAGPHRAVIISSNEDIRDGKPIRVIVISSAFHLAKPEDRVELPYLQCPGGHVHTKLTKKCAAMCRWMPAIEQGDIADYGGWVRGKWLVQILKRVNEIEAEA